MREHGQVGAGGKAEVVGGEVEATELHEVVARATRAELAGGPLAEIPDEGRERPAILVQHVVIGRLAERRPGAELRLAQERAFEHAGRVVEHGARQVEHRQLHAAGDVHADAVRDHGAVGCEHAPDRQAIAAVGVGHERAPHRRRQTQGVLHLLHGVLLVADRPRLEGRGRVSLDEGHSERRPGGDELLGDLGEVGVVRVRAGIGDDSAQLGQRFVPPEPLDRLRQRVQRHAEEWPRLESDGAQIVSADPLHAGQYHSVVGEHADCFFGLDQLLEPANALGEVDQVRRSGALGVAVAQSAVDVPVAPLGYLDRILLDHGAPEARAEGAAREVLDERGEGRVARRVEDDAVEHRVRSMKACVVRRLHRAEGARALPDPPRPRRREHSSLRPRGSGRTWWISSSDSVGGRSLRKPIPVRSRSGSSVVT